MKRLLIIPLWLIVAFAFSEEQSQEPLITNIFVETDLRQALRDLSAQAKVQIIPDSAVNGLVSVEFNQAPLEKCLDMMLIPLGYTYKKIDDYYVATSLNPKSPSFHLISRTEQIKLHHTTAMDVIYNLPSFLRAYIAVNKTKNILTVTAPDEIIRRIKEIVKTLDQKSKQVLIEVLVTEVSDDALQNIGVNWMDALDLSITGDYLYDKIHARSLTDESIDVEEESSLRVGVARQNLLSIVMQDQSSGIKIKARPRIMTANTEEAIINIGTEQYVSLETGTIDRSYNRLEAVDAGIKLKIVPIIGENDEITLDVAAEVSDIAPGQTNEDVKLTVYRRTAKTKVQLDDGQTISIGGLLQENEVERMNRVPFLGRIPFLGRVLFSSKKTVKVNSELIIFITPQIINDASSGDDSAILHDGNT